MKPGLFLFLVVLSYCIDAAAQCPPSGMKIQSQACEEPKNLSAKMADCDTLVVRWQGNQNQSYTVTVSMEDTANNQVSKQDITQYNCKGNGSCMASVPVRQGSTIHWCVSAICRFSNTVIYSNPTEAKTVSVPYCFLSADRQADFKTDLSGLVVYPNPASDHVTVDYRSKASGATTLSVADATGKIVLDQVFAVIQGRNRYRLNVLTLLPGVYVLSVRNGQETSHVKFTVMTK